MQIDWFTFVAQIFNFLVLVVVLKFLLYDRVLKAVRERREKIRSEFEKAERKADEADGRREEYERKLEEFEKEKERGRSDLAEELEEKRQQGIEELREEIEEKRAEWMESLGREKESFLGDLRRKASGEIFLSARTMLRDLADEELESRIAGRFAGMLEDLDEESRKEMAGAVSGNGGGLEVRSSFGLSEDLRERISEAAAEGLGEEVEIEFEEDAELVCGIELRTGGVKISWNVDDYLDDLERMAGEMIDRAARSAPKRGAPEKGSKEEVEDGGSDGGEG